MTTTTPRPTRGTLVADLTAGMQRNAVRIQVGPVATPAKDVKQGVYAVHGDRKLDLLSTILREPEVTSALVFLRTKHRTDRIAKALHKEGFKAEAIHGGRSQRQRQQAIDGFRAGRYQVLVATDVAARGLDVQGVTHVVNFDIPNTSDDYIHRIGRTARANATGDAITFVSPEDAQTLGDIERALGKPLPREDWEGAVAVRSCFQPRADRSAPRGLVRGGPQRLLGGGRRLRHAMERPARRGLPRGRAAVDGAEPRAAVRPEGLRRHAAEPGPRRPPDAAL